MKRASLTKKIIVIGLVTSLTVCTYGCGKETFSKVSDGNIAYYNDIEYYHNTGYYDDTEYLKEYTEGCTDNSMSFDGSFCLESEYATDFIAGYEYNTNEYNDLAENTWLSVQTSPLSTFAADVDTASYANLRSNIENGHPVPASSIRIEEMINYFHYDYEAPKKGEKFVVCTEFIDCPWNEDTKLALVSLNTEKIDFSDAPKSNLVFLIDVSGSMFDSNKLPLIQQSLCMLAENLTEKDRVSIVTYAGDDAVVLEGTPGNDYYTISSAIENLEAFGSTNGSAGIETAYEIAEKYFIEDGNNRVILATDGDLNVGITSEGELEKLISEKKNSGVYLSVLGVGYGNYKDNKLETLADKGNGNYSFIDSVFEAKKALVDEMGATMVTVAKDVKLQVEFNPAYVKGYRLIGYENRVMAAEEFADDTKDGGEMGAGHSVTALYEIALNDSDMDFPMPDLKYNSYNEGNKNLELFTLNVRYKEPNENESKLLSYVCTNKNYSLEGSDNIRWAAAVCGFGLYLKNSEYAGTVDKNMIIKLATSVSDYKTDDYKAEFISLVEKYDRELEIE